MSHIDVYKVWDFVLFLAGCFALCVAGIVVETNPRRDLNRFLGLICAAFAIIIASQAIRGESHAWWQKGLAHAGTRIATTAAILGAFLAADSLEESIGCVRNRLGRHKLLCVIALVPTMTIPWLWMPRPGPRLLAVFEWDSLLAIAVIALTEFQRRQRLSPAAKYEHRLLMCLIGTGAITDVCFIGASWVADHTARTGSLLSIADRIPMSMQFVGTVGFAAQLVMPAGMGLGTAMLFLLKVALQFVAALLAVVAVLALANVNGAVALLVIAGASAGVGGWVGISFLWTTFGSTRKWSRDREVLEIVAAIAKSEADEDRLVVRFTALVAQYLSAGRIEWVFGSEGPRLAKEGRPSPNERLVELAVKFGWITSHSLLRVAQPRELEELRRAFAGQALGIILAEKSQHWISVLRIRDAPGVNVYRRTTIATLREALQTVNLARERAILAADAMQDRSLVNFGHRVLERAHEDRNYLDALAFAVRLLADGRENELTPEHRAAIAAGFEDYLSMRNLELDLNRAGAISIARVQASRIVGDLGRIYSASARKQGIEFDAPDGDPALWLRTDRRLVIQLLLNLVSNSAKAVERSSRKTIRVQAVARESWVEFKIEDSGPGLSDDKVRSFNSGPDSSARSGLGLTICQKIAEVLGGSIHYARGNGDIGAIFRVVLPRSLTEES